MNFLKHVVKRLNDKTRKKKEISDKKKKLKRLMSKRSSEEEAGDQSANKKGEPNSELKTTITKPSPWSPRMGVLLN